jgi:hypothetical protein
MSVTQSLLYQAPLWQPQLLIVTVTLFMTRAVPANET